MFIIRSKNKNYDWKYKHEKVIVFDSQEEANFFLSNFANFALQSAMGMVFQEGPDLLQDVTETMNNTTIIPLPDNYDKVIIKFSEIIR